MQARLSIERISICAAILLAAVMVPAVLSGQGPEPVEEEEPYTQLLNEGNNGGEKSARFLTPGVTWNLPGTWEVGLGAPIGLTADAA